MKYWRLIVLPVIFLICCVDADGQEKVTLNVRVDQADQVTAEALYRKLRMSNVISLNYTDLPSKIEQIIEFYENSGFPFVQVSIDSVSSLTSGVSGDLMIRPGDFVRVDTVMNRTGFRISSSVLYRLLGIRPGDPYRESAFQKASFRLNRITYLKQMRPMEVGFHPGKAALYVFPEKASANRFDGWVGLSPNLGASGKLAFSGALNLNLNNTLGQGENWAFDWRRNQDGSQKLDLGTHVPYLAGLPFGIEGGFNLYRQDTSYLNVEWKIGVPYHFGPNHLINLFIKNRESSILGAISDLKNTGNQPFKSMLSGLTWELNQLDNPINPYRGFEIRIEASTGRKRVQDSTAIQQSEFGAKFTWFQPLAKRVTCAFLLTSGYRNSLETLDNEQYRVGGVNLLRGFDEDVFHTDAFAVTSLEFRYLLDRVSHLVVLADVGFLRNSRAPNPGLNVPFGIGMGGQVSTSGGIFRIIFAVGKEESQSFNMKNSKIHLGYVGVF